MPPRIRILSAGCAAGQEPYTIAMCVNRWLETREEMTWENFGIYGTDISREVLQKANRAVYSELELGKNLPEDFRKEYFSKSKTRWKLKERIKNMVFFSEMNLAENFTSVGRFDIIFCRNVIIYFPIELKKKIFAQFYRIINPGGVLIMGASESIYNLSDDFTIVREGKSTYYVPRK